MSTTENYLKEIKIPQSYAKYYEELFISIPFLSSIFILISTITYPILLPKLTSLDLLVGSFIGSFVLLSIPLVLMSALNPILI